MIIMEHLEDVGRIVYEIPHDELRSIEVEQEQIVFHVAGFSNFTDILLEAIVVPRHTLLMFHQDETHRVIVLDMVTRRYLPGYNPWGFQPFPGAF